jgi:FMN phosphatase YigB (HAD superfamily)
MPISNILIEFDHTLFNTSQIKYEWATLMEKNGVPMDVFWQTYSQAHYDEAGRPSYNPKKHVEIVKDYLKAEPDEVVRQMEEVKTRGKDFLFPDAENFLNRMVSINAPLTLILRGEPEYQKEKAESAGVMDYFNKVHLSNKNRLEMVEELNLKPEEKTFWISHDLADMTKVKEKYPFIVPVVKRRPDIRIGHYRQVNLLNFDNFKEIQDYLTVVHATSY